MSTARPIALVTGASGNLGREVVTALLKANLHVVGLAREASSKEMLAAGLSEVVASIDTPENAAQAVARVIAEHGRIDHLVHLIGAWAGGTPLAETAPDLFKKMLDINLNSGYYLLRAAIPELRKSGNARIVAIGSRSATEPSPNSAAYGAAKAALASLVRSVAVEERQYGIRANIILPTTMDTSVNRAAMPAADTSKWVKPANVASLIAWLLGDAGNDVNGAVIPVYGLDV